ncbi:MAG: protoporphyrinogen oxidase [Nitrospirae bacterium]|nr:protoporphyrinogen oxidase [Nitrospirota bacterium]
MSGRVIVIGGGISGLATAYWMARKGMDVTLLERENRAGGCIRTEALEGYRVDHAANCLLNFLPEVDQLCQGVGLSSRMVSRGRQAGSRYLVKDGRLLPVPAGLLQFAKTPIWSLKGKARLLLEPFMPAPHGVESNGGTDESVARFVRRRLGREMLDYAVEPFIAGSYAGDVDRLSVRSTFPRLWELEHRYRSLVFGALVRRVTGSRTSCVSHLFSFDEGMEVLPGAIARFLGSRFLPGRRVKGLEPVKEGWEVAVVAGSRGEETRMTADVVVVSAPADETSRLMSSLSPPLRGLLSGIEYSPLAVVHLGFSRGRVLHPLDGMGCLVPRREGGMLLGSLWSSVIFPRRAPLGKAVLTNYVGGARNPGAIDLKDEALLDGVLRDLRYPLGIRQEPEFVKIVRHPRALPQYTLGHPERLGKIGETLRSFPGLFLSGNYLDGVSVRDCIARGKRTAGRVSEYLMPRNG